MDRRQDPRTIVTPYAFSVHPDLLGMPLATPWQRLGAIALDGVVIFGLSRIGGVTLAVASGILLFWLAVRKPARDVFGKLFRVFVGCLGILVLTVAVVVIVSVQFAQRYQNDPEALAGLLGGISDFADSADIRIALGEDAATDSLSLGDLTRLFPNFLALQRTTDPDEARELASEMAWRARDGGMSLHDIRTTLSGLMPNDAPWSGQSQTIVDDVMAELRQGIPEPPPETNPIPEDAPPASTEITDSLALDSIAALNDLVVKLDEERQDAEANLERTEAQLNEAESGGLLDRLWNLIDDLGLGFGWGALYMTITHAWWKGTSVGKKIFRIRVVMIDKRPLNWWLSFERAGGYAAGLATGLLGFAQVFWDPNRQAIHDKVSETIVIQDGKKPVPGPWLSGEEGSMATRGSSGPAP